MCSDNTWKILLLFERREWQHAETCFQCLAKQQWQRLRKPSTAYEIYKISARQTTFITFSKRAVRTCEKLLWQHMKIHPLLNKYAVTMTVKLSLQLFKREQSKHVENYIHWLVKQQWQHMDIHPLLIKCARTTHEKPSTTLWKKGVTICRKPHPLLNKTTVTAFTEIHPLLTKYARSVEGKLNALLFQRE